jgi:hypothetical protein
VRDDGKIKRTFKTAWFAKAANKARITDDDLCEAIRAAMQGQADDLGGGVFKKRLDRNRHRSIILAKGGRYWVYVYLFAKKDRANIDDSELKAFRDAAAVYARKTDDAIDRELSAGKIVEICNDREEKIQE